jgi:hypothetical protein
MNVYIGGEHIAHLVQSNKPMYKYFLKYFLNWVQLSYDFAKVVPSGTTQGKVCPVKNEYYFIKKHLKKSFQSHFYSIYHTYTLILIINFFPFRGWLYLDII